MNELSEDFQEVLKHNVRLAEVFRRIAIGDELQMTKPLLEAMTLLSASKTLKSGSSSLFLTQVFATVGIDRESSAIGFIGPSVNRVVDSLTEGLLSEALFTPKATLANAMLLKKIVKGVVIFSIGAGKVLALKNKTENNETAQIYNRMVLLLVASSKILKTTFEELILACGGDEKSIINCADVLSLVTLLMMGITAIQGNSKDFSLLIEILNRNFRASLEKVDELISNGIAEHKIDSRTVAGIHAAISQAKLSLQNGSSDDFMQAIQLAIEATGVTKVDLDQDVLEIENVILNVYNTINTDLDEFSKSSTEISVVA